MPDSPVVLPHDPVARARGAELDPVLASLPDRYRFSSTAAALGRLIRIAGLTGGVAIVAGMGLITTELLPVVAGAVVIIVGFAMVVPMLMRPRVHGDEIWTDLTCERGDATLRSAVLWSDGDPRRAAELHQLFAEESDARRWPTLVTSKRRDGVRVGVHRRAEGTTLVLTLWLLTESAQGEQAALCWPVVETSPMHLDDWLARLHPRQTVSTQSLRRADRSDLPPSP